MSDFKTGMFLLENITSGMYNNPLDILREYIQNSVDSIDIAHQNSSASSAEIRISLEPFEKRIIIRDNGQGIPFGMSEEILCSIGSSCKDDPRLRGFRGIGRLGGVAFCNKAVFRTKAEGESLESIQEWDCVSLRRVIGERREKPLSLEKILSRITSFSHEKNKKAKGSYFEVRLEGVTSFRNYLFDIMRVKRYLSQVAPVPFSPEFQFGKIIEEHLRNRLSHHRCYNIYLNGQQVYKPYSNFVRVSKGDVERLTGIKFVDFFGADGQSIGLGWYGIRSALLGAISRGEDCSGLRVRSGNIMIGDNHLLDECFREARFNNYIPGEVHVDSQGLIPNSRRDDFVDNMIKNSFYNAVEREVGLPISKLIREKSRMSSQKKPSNLRGNSEHSNEEIARHIEMNNLDKKTTGQTNSKYASVNADITDVDIELARKIVNICSNCPKLTKLLPTVYNS